jgi:uncharacterized protein (TIGR02246 family)
MRRLVLLASLLLSVWTLTSCDTVDADLVRERQAVMKLMDDLRRAHLDYDAEAVVGLLTDPFIDVKDGEVAFRSRAENLQRFTNYFGNVVFDQWQYIEPPTVTVSGDATLAVVIARMKVVLHPRESSDEAMTERTVFAMMARLEKVDGRWRFSAVASTEILVTPESAEAGPDE